MLEAEHRTTLVEGEPDARSMGMGAGRKPPSYNVQAAVDVETSLIVHHEVTTEPTDNRLLYPMARATKEQWKPIRSRWWRMRATPMGRTRPHASARHHALRAGEQGREQSRRLL